MPMKLLSAILNRDRAALEHCLAAGPFDSGRFADFSDSQSLSGALFPILSGPELSGLFPRSLIDRLKSVYLTQWEENERFLKEMARLSGLFAEAGIGSIFLKGPLLARRFYGDTAARAIADIDILVRPEDIGAAEKLLTAAGFSLVSGFFLGRGLSSYFAHHFEYRKDALCLELHWLLQRHPSFRFDTEALWGRARTFDCDGKSFRVLSDEDELLLQLLSLANDIQLGTARVRTPVDIVMILGTMTDTADWERFFAHRKSEGTLSISATMLSLALEISGLSGRFPKLSGELAKHSRLIRLPEGRAATALFEPSRSAIRNKLWAWGMYTCGFSGALCWWAVSLPFRMAVYRKPALNAAAGR